MENALMTKSMTYNALFLLMITGVILSGQPEPQTKKTEVITSLGEPFKEYDQARTIVFNAARQLLKRWPLETVMLPNDPMRRQEFVKKYNGIGGYTYDIRLVEKVLGIGDKANGPLMELLTSPHPVYRVFAMECLYKINRERSILILSLYLSDNHPVVRAYCATLLESHFAQKNRHIPWVGSNKLVKNSKDYQLYLVNQKRFIKWYVEIYSDMLAKQQL